MSFRVLGLPLVGALFFSACGDTESSPQGRDADAGESSGGSSAGEAATAGSTSGGQPHAGAAGSSAAGAPNPDAGAGGTGDGGAHEGGTSSGGDAADGGADNVAGQGGTGGQGGDQSDPLPVRPNFVFVSSKKYVPKALGGLEGADTQCSELATAAGLDGHFVAWLSTSTVDAKDRLGAASAWRNTQNNPFADQPNELFGDEQVYQPVRFDENGDAVTGLVATGTSPRGVAAAENCNDWSSDSGSAALVTGDPTAGSALWTADYDGSSCAEQYHLYCFQIDYAGVDYPTPSQGRTVFVSSQPFVLGAQGRDAADQLCATDAATANLGGGPYLALLGNASSSALDRLTQPTRPWVRPDGMVVANGNSAFSFGPLNTPITQLADSSHAGGVAIFGAPKIGDKADLNCENWTNPNAAVPAVIHGTTGYTDARWFAAETAACSQSARVLCVEQ